MTSITPDLARGRPLDPTPRDHYLNHSRGFLSWALTLDHKRIGIMYLASTLFAFFLGGMFAEIVRTQLLVPNGALFHFADPNAAGSYPKYRMYDQAFTLHG